MEKENPIGLFDSGIGGLSVLKQFIRFLPNENYIYLGDTARVPYGNKSVKTVIKYAIESTEFLLSHNVKLIVVACNTVSAIALEEVRKISTVPVIGMIQPAALAATRSTINNKIGVIGTRATINSKAYLEAIINLQDSKQIQVVQQECPLFVPIVEEGWLRHPATRLIAEEYLKNLIYEEVDTIVLGCTHYPLLAQLISEIIPGIMLIDSGEHASVTAIRLLGEARVLKEETGDFAKKPSVKFFITDFPITFYENAQRFLGFDVEQPIIISLDKY